MTEKNLTKSGVTNSILFFAKMYGIESGYEALLKEGSGLPTLSKMIIQELFINGFNPYHCNDLEYENYKILREYSKTLRDKGWVEFQK